MLPATPTASYSVHVSADQRPCITAVRSGRLVRLTGACPGPGPVGRLNKHGQRAAASKWRKKQPSGIKQASVSWARWLWRQAGSGFMARHGREMGAQQHVPLPAVLSLCLAEALRAQRRPAARAPGGDTSHIERFSLAPPFATESAAQREAVMASTAQHNGNDSKWGFDLTSRLALASSVNCSRLLLQSRPRPTVKNVHCL